VLTTKSSMSMAMSMDTKRNLFIFSLVTLTGISEASLELSSSLASKW
jgi:hypothetical protein